MREKWGFCFGFNCFTQADRAGSGILIEIPFDPLAHVGKAAPIE